MRKGECFSKDWNVWSSLAADFWLLQLCAEMTVVMLVLAVLSSYALFG